MIINCVAVSRHDKSPDPPLHQPQAISVHVPAGEFSGHLVTYPPTEGVYVSSALMSLDGKKLSLAKVLSQMGIATNHVVTVHVDGTCWIIFPPTPAVVMPPASASA